MSIGSDERIADGQPDLLDSVEAGGHIVRGGMLRVASYAAGSLVSVLGSAVVTRHLGPADFGRYSAIFSLTIILLGLTDAGTQSLGVREHVLRDPAGSRRLLANLMGLRLALGAAGVAVAVAFSLIAGYDHEMVIGAFLASVGMIAVLAYGTLLVPLLATLRNGRVALLEFLRQAVTVVGLLVCVALGTGIVPLLGVPLPIGVVLIVATLVIGQGRGAVRPALDRDEWSALLRVTLPFAVASAVGIIYAHVSILLMSLISTERETGLFGAAFRIYFVLATAPSLLVVTALPLMARAARDDRVRLRYAVQRIFEACVVAGAGTAVVTAVSAPAAIRIVAGGDFADAVPALRLLSVALMGTFLVALATYGLLTTHRYRALLVANALGLVVSGTLTGVLGASAGAEGAAGAVAIADVTLAIMQLVALGRGADGVVVSLKVVPRALVAAGAALSAGILCPLPAVPTAALAGLVFIAAAAVMRIVPTEILAAARSWRGG